MSQESVFDELDRIVEDLGMAEGAPPTAGRRGDQARRSTGDEPLTLRFVDRDGVLLLDDGALPAPTTQRRGGRPERDQAVWEKDLARLEPNKVGAWLESLDGKLTPGRGLRAYDDGAYEDAPDLTHTKRALLFVHGTFSHTANIMDAVQANSVGSDFFAWAGKRYDRILTFDHPTLSVSPLVNARTLALALDGCGADIDVVCHSRGGLVTRWWLEGFDRGPGARRSVFVASPLAGTGLAAPPNLRASLSLLSNFAKALGAVSAAVPFLTFVSGVFRVLGSVAGVAAKTPAVDAAVALVPGLASMQRVGNNRELQALRAALPATQGRYFAVGANFEPKAPGWKFWRYFRRENAMDTAVNRVFDGFNDLVVDTDSMIELARDVRIPDGQILDFGTTADVHHTNYFGHARTLDFIREALDPNPRR